jgi:hypothetical protein
MKTRFQNLFYLEQALTKLQIPHEKENILIKNDILKDNHINLRIPQLNGHDIKFCWNKTESKKIGFQPVKYQKNDNGSNTLILERWNKNVE